MIHGKKLTPWSDEYIGLHFLPGNRYIHRIASPGKTSIPRTPCTFAILFPYTITALIFHKDPDIFLEVNVNS